MSFLSPLIRKLHQRSQSPTDKVSSKPESVHRLIRFHTKPYQSGGDEAIGAGYRGVEEIAARFGVTPHVVRQRLRLGAVSPKLMQAYRDVSAL